jgi:hypothetical protein
LSHDPLATATLPHYLQEAKGQINGNLPRIELCASEKSPAAALREELERQPYDLVVLGAGSPENARLAERVLVRGEHHLLFVPPRQPAPTRALICVASGEPGKEDVLFTGRLLRHLNADATLLTVLPATENPAETQERAQRFLEDGVHTLGLMGVQARTHLRFGPTQDQILRELATDDYGLLVLGAPLPDVNGGVTFSGLVDDLLRLIKDQMVLIVRSSAQVGTSPLLVAQYEDLPLTPR